MTDETDRIRSAIMEVLWSPPETVTATADAILDRLAKEGYAIVTAQRILQLLEEQSK